MIYSFWIQSMWQMQVSSTESYLSSSHSLPMWQQWSMDTLQSTLPVSRIFHLILLNGRIIPLPLQYNITYSYSLGFRKLTSLGSCYFPHHTTYILNIKLILLEKIWVSHFKTSKWHRLSSDNWVELRLKIFFKSLNLLGWISTYWLSVPLLPGLPFLPPSIVISLL